jgi:hypothetical protein
MNGDQPRSRSEGELCDAAGELGLHYRQLRAPAESGCSLQIPPLAQTVSGWTHRTFPANEIEVGGRRLDVLKQQARPELLKLARQYSSRYRDIDLAGRDTNSIVMSGHQPLLFHPGVWFKNFALSSIGSAVGATCVNLVVDNDVCGPAAVKCPSFKDGKASTGLIEIDAAVSALPYERRSIVDESLFASFADRAAEHVSDCFGAFGQTADPLVRRLWRHVKSARNSIGRDAPLGAILAAGRHRLECDFGLQTLEVPVSTVAQTETFCHFASAIMKEQDRFNDSYNVRLLEYRQLHKIRSSSHPVPELEQDAGWLEAPFWVWSKDQPQRRRLFLKEFDGTITLTDRERWEVATESASLAATLVELYKQQIAVRPRALITTLYCRLVLSDLFLHGIGGAKYDQLTDVIAADFFGATLPPFSTMTATMHLPFDVPVVTQSDQTRIRQQIRQRKFHPERFINSSEINSSAIDSSEVESWVSKKMEAIADASSDRKERHHEIETANRMLQPFVSDDVKALESELAEVREKIETSRVLNSREFSFCLFDESLVEELRRLTEVS